MELNISDLLDGLEENSVPIQTKPVASATRIKELTMKKVENQSQQRRYAAPHSLKRILTLAAAAALVLALGVTAYAMISHEEFFHNAYGNGIPSQEAHTEEIRDPEGELVKIESFPAEERVENDSERSEELLGDYVSAIGQSLQLADYTVTVEDVVLDQNGIGAVSVFIEEPDGHCFRGDGQLHYPYLGCVVRGAEGSFISFRDFPVEGSDTGDTIRMVYYLCPGAELPRTEDLQLDYTVYGEGHVEQAAGSITIPAGERAPAMVLQGEGAEAEISPMGLHLRYTFDPTLQDEIQFREYIEDEIVIRYRDGSSYTVRGSGLINSPVSAQKDNELWEAFNRVVDVDQVEEVIITGHMTTQASNADKMMEQSFNIALRPAA